MPLLSARDLTIRYGGSLAVERVSFDIAPGERLVVLGRSGCGKSSLLKAVGGFIRPASGSLSLNGVEILKPGPDRLMVFQEFDQLLPWKTVLGNVEFLMRASGKFAGEDATRRARAALERVGLTDFADAYPYALSGGMKQRVAIARALAAEPAVLLMDEPFAALDALTRRDMQKDLLALWSALEFTMLFVTHSIEEAIKLGSRILVMSPHPGRLIADLAVTESPDAAALERQIASLLGAGEMVNA